jgi:hypothetical protein
LYSARNSQAVFRAIRQRPLVEEAEAQQEEVEASTRVAIDNSWASLREVATVILGYGALAEAITGLPKATLARIVRTTGAHDAVPEVVRCVLRSKLRPWSGGSVPARSHRSSAEGGQR